MTLLDNTITGKTSSSHCGPRPYAIRQPGGQGQGQGKNCALCLEFLAILCKTIVGNDLRRRVVRDINTSSHLRNSNMNIISFF